MHYSQGRMDQGMFRFQKACAYLFSPTHAQDPNFLKDLDTRTIKHAFRKKAKQYHPDLHGHENPDLLLRRKERFIRIKESYEYLNLRIQNTTRKTTSPKKKRAKIIAVGGAKGGIGKSLFVANLSICLAAKGFKTVAADFDLGGSNLHLYLGKTLIKTSINDFLQKKVASLEDVLEKTDYGPKLIGGNSSCLGASNIGFAQKLKLMKAAKGIDADFVVVDLGGDTAYNVLDFFLAADVGVVMTTCDPASYLDAYAFIKVALYRKLNRIFGPESFYSGPGNPVLRRMIQEATLSAENTPTMDQLRQKIQTKSVRGIHLLDKVLAQFSPRVIVNKARDSKSAYSPVKRIQHVSKKTLSIDVRYLGDLPFESGMETSARTLVPFMTTTGAGNYAEKLTPIITSLMGSQKPS